jgi:hypothetical protein
MLSNLKHLSLQTSHTQYFYLNPSHSNTMCCPEREPKPKLITNRIRRVITSVGPRFESSRQRYGLFDCTPFDVRELFDNVTYILSRYLNLTYRQIAKGNIIHKYASDLRIKAVHRLICSMYSTKTFTRDRILADEMIIKRLIFWPII